MCLWVVAGEKELSVTLVWTDPPPAVVSDGSIVNDLELQLFDAPGGSNKKYGRWKVATIG